MPPKRIKALLANLFDLSTAQKSQTLSRQSSLGASLELSPELSRILNSTVGLSNETLHSRPYKSARGIDEDPFEELLLSADEYIALFKCSRGEQTGETGVKSVKGLEEMFRELLQDAKKAIADVDEARKETITKLINNLLAVNTGRIRYLTIAHEKDIQRVRRACRASLADAMIGIVHAAKKERVGSRQRAKTAHRDALREYEEKIFELKRESRKKADVISRLRTNIAKAQYTLKKAGVLEVDSYQIINDERIRADETIDYYQHSLIQREEKIASLVTRLTDLEFRAEEAGVLPSTARWTGQPAPTTGRRSNISSRTGGTRWGGGIGRPPMLPPGLVIPLPTQPVEGPQMTKPLGSMTRAEKLRAIGGSTINLCNEINEIYTHKLEQMRHAHSKAVAAAVLDRQRVDTELAAKFAEVQKGLKDVGWVIEGSIARSDVLKTLSSLLFPRTTRPGLVSTATECHLDPFEEDEAAKKQKEKEEREKREKEKSLMVLPPLGLDRVGVVEGSGEREASSAQAERMARNVSFARDILRTLSR
ncbi:hypothetical protein HDV00_011998 [Rhizophlyctis rosea]|nr:hypothetical protein HDV00_011998 [Rhizophlyctis rosea]